MVERCGYRVHTVGTGADAIRAVESSAYDLILMDCQMPAMDGYEATRRLRAGGFQAPIIALTAHAMQGDRQRCLTAGMDDYITKPLRGEALRSTLEHWLNASRVNREATAEAAQ